MCLEERREGGKIEMRGEKNEREKKQQKPQQTKNRRK